MIRARKFPVIGGGGGVWSFVHIENAAGATVAALERWAPEQIYNAVDDDPAPVREWLAVLAEVIGAKPPRHVPRWAGRMAGALVVALLCESRRASNLKARSELGWTPSRPSWRQGFAELARPAGDA